MAWGILLASFGKFNDRKNNDHEMFEHLQTFLVRDLKKVIF